MTAQPAAEPLSASAATTAAPVDPAASGPAREAEDRAFRPLLTTTDWAEEWKRLQAARRRADDASYWDARAKSFGSKDSPGHYVNRFLELAGVREGESAFDMGCGTGALAMPLGLAGHRVVAADFSEGMLSVLRDYLSANDVTCVETVRMSWEDDWAAHGVEPGSVDVALASRSIATSDIRDSLLRLDAVARRRVCITLPTGSSPRINDRMLADIGYAAIVSHDYQYALNILIQAGILPQIAYIESERKETYASADEAIALYDDMIEHGGTAIPQEEIDEAKRRMREWMDDQLIANPTAGAVDSRGRVEGPLTLKKPRANVWAFISWDKR